MAQLPAAWRFPSETTKGPDPEKDTKDGQRVMFLKANADGTADVQVRTPGANRYMPEKVETRTVPMGDVLSTGMKDTLTEAEWNAYRRGVAE